MRRTEDRLKITITLTKPEQGKSYDIQVSNTQKITDTLQVLQDNLLLFDNAERIRTIRENGTGKRIDTEQTYEEAKVYSGAELIIQEGQLWD